MQVTQPSAPEDGLGRALNLGPRSRQMLAEAGVTTLEQLRARGAVAVFSLVRRNGANASLNLLWALEGALLGLPWQQVAHEHRTRLLMALEDEQRSR